MIKRATLAWVSAGAFLLAYETLALALKWETLSGAVWRLSHDWPLLPFAAGILCGHFFWQRRSV